MQISDSWTGKTEYTLGKNMASTPNRRTGEKINNAFLSKTCSFKFDSLKKSLLSFGYAISLRTEADEVDSLYFRS